MLSKPLDTTAAGLYRRLRLRIDQPVRISQGLARGLRSGWYPPDGDQCAWTDSPRAVLAVTLDRDVAMPAALKLHLFAFVPEQRAQKVVVSTPSRQLNAIEFSSRKPAAILPLTIAAEDLSADRGCDLLIEVECLISPKIAIGADDARYLGIALTCIVIEEEKPLSPGGLDLPPPRGRLDFLPPRIARILRRIRARLRGDGLLRGSLYLAKALIRRLLR
ncbi:hypothetical protein [Plastoroseomonas hellenica]|uniref:hypothetical protein n=1 Tax=Plastoroseomonas hellenica TaxID=2687306 RepID=UPI001BA5A1DD|nr:hypothetical protein [Plastoroseomonas hellenica]MBR0644697.1 hypothetical protein [Plastoroseomonas hellenica]